MSRVRMFFTELRLWLTQIGVPIGVAYLWLKANPKVMDLIAKDAKSIKDIFVGGKK